MPLGKEFSEIQVRVALVNVLGKKSDYSPPKRIAIELEKDSASDMVPVVRTGEADDAKENANSESKSENRAGSCRDEKESSIDIDNDQHSVGSFHMDL